MKTFLSLIICSGLLALATQVSIAIPVLSSMVAFSFSVGLLVWMVAIYSRKPRVLFAERPLHLPIMHRPQGRVMRAGYRKAA